ncbi:MAG: hypothetical protein GXP24_02240 [Planctomycetes bacterium]|nr:hypothetical protein [Planctomycetota bacterium]
MLQQLKQVGLTYVTRPRMWWWAAFVSFFFELGIPLTWDSGRNPDSQSQSFVFLFFCLYSSVLPFIYLQDHTTWQFNHSRARLVPNFNRAHLTFTAFVLFFSLVAVPTLFGITTGGSTLVLMAGTALVISVWSRESQVLRIALISLLFFHENPWIAWLLNASDGSNTPVLLLLLLASWAAIGWWLCCLGSRHEEQSDYDLHNYADSNQGKSRTFRMAADRKQSEEYSRGRFKVWQLDRGIEHVLAKGRTSPKWRLLCLGNRPNKASSLRLLGIFDLMLVCVLFFVYREHGTVSGNRIAELLHSMTYGLWLLTFLGAAFYGMQLAERAPYMVSESLFPLSKKQYFSDLLRGLATTAVQQWAIVHIAIGVLLFLPLSTEYPPPSINTCLSYLWISLASLAFTCSFVTLLSCTMRGLIGAIIVAVVCATTTGILFFTWLGQRETAGDAPFVLAAAGLMAVSWYFTIGARKEWANIEVGDTREE